MARRKPYPGRCQNRTVRRDGALPFDILTSRHCLDDLDERLTIKLGQLKRNDRIGSSRQSIAGSYRNQWKAHAPKDALACTANPSRAARLLAGIGPAARMGSVSTRPRAIHSGTSSPFRGWMAASTQAIAALTELLLRMTHASSAVQRAAKPSHYSIPPHRNRHTRDPGPQL